VWGQQEASAQQTLATCSAVVDTADADLLQAAQFSAVHLQAACCEDVQQHWCVTTRGKGSKLHAVNEAWLLQQAPYVQSCFVCC
jgi:hypothetical protein